MSKVFLLFFMILSLAVSCSSDEELETGNVNDETSNEEVQDKVSEDNETDHDKKDEQDSKPEDDKQVDKEDNGTQDENEPEPQPDEEPVKEDEEQTPEEEPEPVENPNSGEVIFFEDFESAASSSNWRHANLLSPGNNPDFLTYHHQLWFVGTPDYDGQNAMCGYPAETPCDKGFIKKAYSGEKLIGTGNKYVENGSNNFNNLKTSASPINEPYSFRGIRNAFYSTSKIDIPKGGAIVEFFAYLHTEFSNADWRDGMVIYTCEEAKFEAGQKCEPDLFWNNDEYRIYTSTYKPLINISAENLEGEDVSADFVGNFEDRYGVFNSNPEDIGIRGQAEYNTFVKFRAEVPSKAYGRSVHLIFEFSGNRNESARNPGNSAGIYIDDIKVIVK